MITQVLFNIFNEISKLCLAMVWNPIVFEGHKPKFKVTGVKKIAYFGRISPFPYDKA